MAQMLTTIEINKIDKFFIVTGLSDAYLRTSIWDGYSSKENTKVTDTRRFRFHKVL